MYGMHRIRASAAESILPDAKSGTTIGWFTTEVHIVEMFYCSDNLLTSQRDKREASVRDSSEVIGGFHKWKVSIST